MKTVNEKFEKVKKGSYKLRRVYPGTMSLFEPLQNALPKEEVLPVKLKELIALALAVNVRCDSIVNHVNDALKAGASDQEIAETIRLAVLAGGRPSIKYGNQALEALTQIEKQEVVEFFFY